MSSNERKFVFYARKLIVAVLFGLLFFLLSIFAGVGYRVYGVRELDFVPNSDLGYADVTFKIDILYNPVLYPLYWMIGSGRVNAEFSVIYVPEHYRPGEFGSANWGSRSERENSYVLRTLGFAGVLPNLLVLFIWTIAIEIVRIRGLYVILFSGVLGFYALEVMGAILGLVVGILVVLLLVIVWTANPIQRFWGHLWKERQEPAMTYAGGLG